MLQSHIAKSPENADARPALRLGESDRELHPRHARITGACPSVHNSSASLAPAALVRRRSGDFQKSIGNQALLRRMSSSSAQCGTTALAVIRRKCSCGGEGPACDACSHKHEDDLLQRKAVAPVTPAGVPGVVHQVLKSPGQPLHTATRAMFEPRFGRSFEAVRVHTGPQPARSARAIDALAYTAGNNIVFGEGSYLPHSLAGQRLLAHELAHVAQQDGVGGGAGNLRVGNVHDPAEADADRVADSVMKGDQAYPALAPPAIRRTVVVAPATAAAQIATHFGVICPGRFSAAGSNVTGACDASTTAGCDCLCDVVNDTTRTYTVNVADATKGTAIATLADGSAATVPVTSLFPATTIAPNPAIGMPSTSSNIEFGEFNSGGGAIWVPLWRVLEHELCGHARLNQVSGGSRGNRPGHDSTIDTENLIAAEQGQPLRGRFSDPRQGESFFNPTGDRSKVLFFQKDGEHFEAP